MTIRKNDIQLPTSLESERLFLRPYRDGDEKIILDMLENDNREYLKELLGSITNATDLIEIKKWISSLSNDWDRHNRFILSIWDKDNLTYYGHIWIEPVNWDIPQFEIGWLVDKNFQGRGIVTEAAKRSINFIFHVLQGHKITVRVLGHGLYVDKSIQISKRCGFKREGYLRDTVRLEDGKLINEHYYGLLRNDYFF